MTKLDEVMMKHIQYLVYEVGRPFTHRDFELFEVDGEKYEVKHGTFRNKISELIKKGIIIVYRNSNPCLYTIKGVRFTTSMTNNHTGDIDNILSPYINKYPHIHNSIIYKLIKNLPFHQRSIHDIRLIFESKGIWSAFLNSSQYNCNPYSDDIYIPSVDISNIDVKIAIHKSDTVSIILGCSFHPVELDSHGLIRFSDTLSRIEERIAFIIKELQVAKEIKDSIIIPNYHKWIVTMWHFGADSLTTYEGERFYVSWEVAKNAIITIYSKKWMDGKKRIRKEVQEYPNATVVNALAEKLKDVLPTQR